MDTLRLRSPRFEDETQVMNAHEQMLVEGFYFATGLREFDTWQDYLSRIDKYQYGPEALWVPATFLIAEVNGVIVGRASIRFELDPPLAREGGHIGYGVIPSERRKGYATEILNQSLDIVFRAGIQRVLVTCTVDNDGSMKVIQRCGGILESVVKSIDGQLVRRFWVEQHTGNQRCGTRSVGA
jgi:predicted acetyltransferase